MLKQLAAFLEEASLFGPSSSGFRKGHSTTTDLLGIRDELKCSVNRVDKSLLLFANCFKVFGNVRFTTALRKMHRFFFSRKLLKCMINYLSDRRHLLQIDDKCSDFARVPIEVPQRSILGHVIFNLNVADLQDGFRC